MAILVLTVGDVNHIARVLHPGFIRKQRLGDGQSLFSTACVAAPPTEASGASALRPVRVVAWPCSSSRAPVRCARSRRRAPGAGRDHTERAQGQSRRAWIDSITRHRRCIRNEGVS